MSETHDPLSFLNGGDSQPAAAPETPAEPVAAEAAPAQPEPAPEPAAAPDGPARGPDGKFVKAEAEPAPSAPEAAAPATPPAAEPAPATPAEPPEGHVPAAAMHAERTARQALERELAELKAANAAPPAPVAPPAPQPPAPRPQIERPDPELEPEAARIWDAMEDMRWQDRLDWSKRASEAKNGIEATAAAYNWAYQRQFTDPGLSGRIKASADPIGFLIDEHRAFQANTLLRDALAGDPEAKKQLAALIAVQAETPTPPADAATPPAPPLAPPAPPIPPVQPPPKSIADATSAGGLAHVPQGSGQAYDGVFLKG